jgi:hypothetical protein
MEVPDGAVLKDGVWHYHAPLNVPELNLTVSPYGRDEYQICLPNKSCQTLPEVLKDAGFEPTESSYVVKVLPCTR